MTQAPACMPATQTSTPQSRNSRTVVARAARLALASLLTGGLALAAQAQSLAELYDSARGHDAGYQSARAQYQASLAKAAQARAGVLPSA